MMEVLNNEIKKFLKNNQYSVSTNKHHKNALAIFVREIAEMTQTPIDRVHLQEIYEVYDNSGNFIMFRPIDAKLIDRLFYTNLHKGYSWLKEQRNALSAFFKYLDRNHDFQNVMLEISFELKKYKPKNKKITCLSKHEILKFFHYLVSNSSNLNRDVLLFTLFITTGCRISEIVNLKLNDIYKADNFIFFPETKHHKSRTMPLRSGLASSIYEYCLQYNIKDSDNLFNLKQNDIRDIFYDLLTLAKLPKVDIHSLRHSFATFMADAGTEITVVQQLLGHSDLFTTKGYVHSNQIRNSQITIIENQSIYKQLSDSE